MATQRQHNGQQHAEPEYDSALLDQVIANTRSIKLGPSGFVATNMGEVLEIAKLYHEGHLAPKDLNTIPKIAIAIEHGMAIGLSPSQSVQSICVINGRPTVWGDACIGLVLNSPLCVRIEEALTGTGDDLTAVCVCWRKGDPNPHKARFSVRMAKRANLWSKAGPWQQYPARMLQMRARSWALRDTFPDVLKGITMREEVEDYVERTEEGGVKLDNLAVSKVGGRPSVTMEDLLKTATLEGEAPDLTPEEVAEFEAKEAERKAKKGEAPDPLAAIEEKLQAAADDNALADLVDQYVNGPDGEGLTKEQVAHIHAVAAEISQRRAALADHPAPPKGKGKQKSAIPADGVGQ